MLKVIFVVISAFVLASTSLKFSSANIKYHVAKTKLSYTQAYATCKQFGWTLASEKNSNESADVTEAIKAVKATQDAFYIGGMLHDDGEFYPNWMWLESGESFDYVNWDKEEPTDEQCLVRQSIDDKQGSWIAGDCSKKLSFVCEAST